MYRLPARRQIGAVHADMTGASWDEGEEDWEGTDVVVEVRSSARTTQRLPTICGPSTSPQLLTPLLVQVNDTAQEVEDSLCTLVASNMRRCILDRGAFTLAIPGGSAAKALAGLPEATAGVDWSVVHIFFVNERLEQKNLKLARVGPIPRSSHSVPNPNQSRKAAQPLCVACAAGGVCGAGRHTSGPAVHPPGWR